MKRRDVLKLVAVVLATPLVGLPKRLPWETKADASPRHFPMPIPQPLDIPVTIDVAPSEVWESASSDKIIDDINALIDSIWAQDPSDEPIILCVPEGWEVHETLRKRFGVNIDIGSFEVATFDPVEFA